MLKDESLRITVKEFTLILAVLLFCDDTTLISDCPRQLQILIDFQVKSIYYIGMQLHPRKCQLIYFNKKMIKKEYKNLEIYKI